MPWSTGTCENGEYLDCLMPAQRTYAAPRGIGVACNFSMLSEVNLVDVPIFATLSPYGRTATMFISKHPVKQASSIEVM
ncbi:hypothetical protein [Shewanella sp.]|uniref:hypothetical protein n=1 Tax=Shewanella sp. TaxID=50422 RepID=UPI003A983D73